MRLILEIVSPSGCQILSTTRSEYTPLVDIPVECCETLEDTALRAAKEYMENPRHPVYIRSVWEGELAAVFQVSAGTGENLPGYWQDLQNRGSATRSGSV